MTIGLRARTAVVIDISQMDANDRLKVTLENGDIYYLRWGGTYTVQWHIDDNHPEGFSKPVRSLGFNNWPGIGLIMSGYWWPRSHKDWKIDSPIVGIAASTVDEMRARQPQAVSL